MAMPTPSPDGESVAAFAPHGTTMAVYLSAARPDELRDELLVDGSGYRPHTPAAVVVRATWPDEQVVLTTVEDVGDAIRSTGARTTVLVLVGDALAGATARVPIVGVSGRGNAADEAAARAAGMDGYLSKPLSPSALTRVLGSVVPPEA